MVVVKSDLLSNDVFLINETEDELINSLTGSYSRMSFFERKREDKANQNRINTFRSNIDRLMALKSEMIHANITRQKEVISEISDELREAYMLEKAEYSNG
jgi:hypothetical protein